jgi:anti-sigma factor RsiW
VSGCSAVWSERLSEYFDGEGGAAKRAGTEAHLAACAACAQLLARYAGLRAGLRAEAAAAAPDSVPARLQARVEGLGAGPVAPGRVHRLHSAAARRFAAVAAALLLALSLLWTGWPRGFNEALAEDLERHHLKAFSRARPCEFESSDPDAVRAWAESQVGYAVHVPQVPGAVLLGARRCKLAGRLSVSLLYRHGNQALTLFAPPQDSSATAQSRAFADGGPRCTQGPVGERICVSVRGDTATIAVSELEDAVLLGALGEVRP